MMLRRTAIFTNLGSNRAGLSERDVQLQLYATSRRQRLLAVFAAGGVGHIKGQAGDAPPACATHKEGAEVSAPGLDLTIGLFAPDDANPALWGEEQ